jgi:hypothetical protein
MVNQRQQGNPLLKHIRNVHWQFADIVPDYQLGASTCAIFLSLRYLSAVVTFLYPPFSVRVIERERERERESISVCVCMRPYVRVSCVRASVCPFLSDRVRVHASCPCACAYLLEVPGLIQISCLSAEIRDAERFSLFRYHLLKPEYIHGRIKELQRSFRLRLLLCHVDVDDVVEPLSQVIRAALLNEVTLICAWSPEVRFPCLNPQHSAIPTAIPYYVL